jgi:hypothetical protein
LPVLQVNSHSIGQKNGEICTSQADLQPISFKSDRLLSKEYVESAVRKPHKKTKGMNHD